MDFSTSRLFHSPFAPHFVVDQGHTLGAVSTQSVRSVRQADRSIQMLIDRHRAARQTPPPAHRLDLQAQMLETDRVVAVDRALELQRENQIQIPAATRHERVARLRRPHLKAAIKFGDVVLAQKDIGRFHRRDPLQPQLLRQPSYALPWPPPRPKQSESSQSESTSEYEFPGLLLFRRSSQWTGDTGDAGPTPTQYLAVFLVPELPSSGIDRATFLSAVRIVRKISPYSAKEGIAMLGPSFSGSVSLLPELRKAIGDELNTAPGAPHTKQEEAEPCLQAISGSATNAPDPFRSRPNPNSCPRAFTALQTSDPCAIKSLVDEKRLRLGVPALEPQRAGAAG